MLRTITELVPFGVDEYSKRISGYYLANVGRSVGPNNTLSSVRCHYVIGYFEKSSPFCKQDIAIFKLIKDYDRMNSNFNMMKEIFSPDGWYDEERFLDSINDPCFGDIEDAVKIFKERAKKDNIF